MFCQKCGNQVPDGSVFCTNCGGSVSQEIVYGQTVKKSMKKPILLTIIIIVCVVVVTGVVLMLIPGTRDLFLGQPRNSNSTTSSNTGDRDRDRDRDTDRDRDRAGNDDRDRDREGGGGLNWNLGLGTRDESATSAAPASPPVTPGNSTPPPATPPSASPATSSQPAPVPPPAAPGGFELALVTDLGTIDDRSFNQFAWEGLSRYAREHNITYKYYQPAGVGDDAYLNAIDLAVQGGARVVVTPGFLFEVPVYFAQDRYPDVKFILLDGSPFSGDYSNYEETIGNNTVSVFFAEEEAGFLAGYAAVKDGFRRLGFMGGMAVPAVVRYGLGYVQGAEYAAQELGLPSGAVTVYYFYTGTFSPSPDIQTRATAWYTEGVEVIFSCGGGICFSIFPAAEYTGNWVIGVDGDQSRESGSVLTSAMKLLDDPVYRCVEDYYNGRFPGGQELLFGASGSAVGLPMDTSRFSSFSRADYDAICAKLAGGMIYVDSAYYIEPYDLPLRVVDLYYFS